MGVYTVCCRINAASCTFSCGKAVWYSDIWLFFCQNHTFRRMRYSSMRKNHIDPQKKRTLRKFFLWCCDDAYIFGTCLLEYIKVSKNNICFCLISNSCSRIMNVRTAVRAGGKCEENAMYERSVKKHRRSEERRVGKECRSRWSPYH